MDANCLYGKFPWEMFNSIFFTQTAQVCPKQRDTQKRNFFTLLVEVKIFLHYNSYKTLEEFYFLKTTFENIQSYREKSLKFCKMLKIYLKFHTYVLLTISILEIWNKLIGLH